MLTCSVPLDVCYVVVMLWGHSISSGEGGLGGISSPRLVEGFSVLHSKAQQVFKGGGVSRATHHSMMGGAQAMGLQLRPAAKGALAASPRCTRPKGLAHAALGGAAWFSDSGDCTISCCR